MTNPSQLDRIENRLESVGDRIGKVEGTLSAQHETLLDHQRRSIANETAVLLLKDELQPLRTAKGIAKLVGWVAGCSGILEVALHLFHRW